ncbi:CD209 antigen-like protein 2 isoform X2 [Saccostrea echinata]|uniref:CD209 antigen-like protein 2 isoform X2 n=1 Tax=Saccostrea echinata TaxID=191078 RepID=UPI002A7F6678|nr:CD209 antigen-like protein 2 isoform X2 [Saccostrea echinata]XP_061169442.1 CD209 antigen-like protein 2 isoform X2 [Saccostrea echinata]
MADELCHEDIIEDTVNNGLQAMVLALGYRVGIIDAMQRLNTPCTAAEISEEAQLNLRYVEEWLICMSSKRIVHYEDGRYKIPCSKRVQKAVHTSAVLPIFASCFTNLENVMKNKNTNTEQSSQGRSLSRSVIKITMFRTLALFYLVVTALGGTCNKPWVNHADSCYLFVTHLQENWSEATSMCTELGGFLVEIETAQEDNFLKNYAIHQLQIQPGGAFGNGSFWIGGTDMLVEGNWFWLSTKQPFAYTDWYATSHEPNGGIRENCAHLGSHVHFHWNDADCHMLYNFICESESIGGPSVVG